MAVLIDKIYVLIFRHVVLSLQLRTGFIKAVRLTTRKKAITSSNEDPDYIFNFSCFYSGHLKGAAPGIPERAGQLGV